MENLMNYTHLISYNEYESWLDMFVSKSFRTTEDAIMLHIDALKKRQYDGQGNQNITKIKVEKI